MGLGSR